MTCMNLVLGSSFSSNLTNKNYIIVSPNDTMNCSSKNIFYLITCRKCGIQYVGKTSRTLRSRMNNHRNRLKQLANFYLYNHLNSDGLSLDDISILPIEAVLHSPGYTTTIWSNFSAVTNFGTENLVQYI